MTFNELSAKLSNWAGQARTFQLAVTDIILRAVTGPIFHYNDTWQLIINTSMNIITFLMVFLIQNTQNRDNDALHIKLDELLRVTKAPRIACSTWKISTPMNLKRCARSMRK